ncbi:DUF4166 domain-containing protein [Bacillus velezensis]|uniref:DUF4166 domain-containing protein n=1 Tax=Bacillus velezensis TaxID=492670 RepID=UPI002DBFCEC6|nr:DUF4166 domain-containing protein [Bacillus velezensis]MEC2312523.1 DUF4166 domain-containing protein [Bacillus velezensis]
MFFLREGKRYPFHYRKQKQAKWRGMESYLFFKSKPRFFDAVMEYDERENRILDYFGKPRILLSELHLEASSDGGLVITSGRQWLLIVGKKIPLPAWLCGSSTVYEAYDEEMNCFSIKVHVKNRILGTLFSYRGTFRETEGETC